MKAEIFNDVIFPFSLLNGPTVHVETRNSQSRKRGRHVRDFLYFKFPVLKLPFCIQKRFI